MILRIDCASLFGRENQGARQGKIVCTASIIAKITVMTRNMIYNAQLTALRLAAKPYSRSTSLVTTSPIHYM